MTTAGRLPWYAVNGTRLTILGIVGMFVLGVIGVAWGTFFPRQVQVLRFDAGPESRFAIGKVTPFPDQNIYVIGLTDGELRAIDGVVTGNDCSVRFQPDDPRGAPRNPNGAPGTFTDPCSGAVWAASGDALTGTDQPLRTFMVSGIPAADGTHHVEVEVLGNRHPQPKNAAK